MSVQDIRFKLILCLCMIFPPLLLSYSHAIYDNFNFLTGVAPYYNTNQQDYSGVYYYPQTGLKNTLQGMVVSFDNKIMSGSQPSNSVPLIDSSHITGKVFELPANSSVAIKLYDMTLYCNTYFSCSNLGYTLPTDFSTSISTLSVANINGNQVAYNNSGAIPVSGSSGTNLFTNMDSCYISTRYTNSITLNNYIPQIWLIVNDSNESLYFSNESALVRIDSPIVTYDAPYILNDNICWLFYDVEFGSATNRHGYRFAIPHINGFVDIYTIQYSNLYITSSASFYVREYDNVICSIGTTDSNNIYVGIDNRLGLRDNRYSVDLALMTENINSDFIPYWINSTYTTQRQAIWIKNGYVAITNYDELISKLQEAGIGQTDLTRVIALLEEINTGGDTGQATKQLMDILEQYHAVLVQQGDTDWATINQQYDTFKYLLDFSGDTIHWIVTANNALFNYFSGFLILCVFFLVLDRLMKG